MPKYLLSDLRKRPKTAAYPDDVNHWAEQLCERAGDKAALEQLKWFKEKRRYGKVGICEIKGESIRMVAAINIVKGIVTNWIQFTYRIDNPKIVLKEENVINPYVSLSKRKDEPKCEKG